MNARPFASRFGLLLIAWFVIAEGDARSFVVGVPLALVAALVSLAAAPPARSRVSLAGLARFAAYFAVQSLRGGIDVASRAYRPSLPLDPAWVRYPLALTEPVERVVFANTISLLPGTLSASFEGDELLVHALDQGQPVFESLQALERSIGALFGHDVVLRQGRDAR
jgi:multicomponent Na+:H+ antiporter subunit E